MFYVIYDNIDLMYNLKFSQLYNFYTILINELVNII